jgi:hypothetical protein
VPGARHLLGLGFASAAAAAAALVAAAPAPVRTAAAPAAPIRFSVPAAPGCPASGRLVEAATPDVRDATRTAASFVRDWYAGDEPAAVRLADTVFKPEARRLAQGPRREPLPFAVQRIGPLGHTDEALLVAHRCGGRILPAVWAADVRRANAAAGAHVLLVKRVEGWRVWAIR